jgi:hypothetical protein
MDRIDDARLQKLIDRQEILDCLTRYTRGVDRFDRDLLLSAYHPDARDDHGVFVGTAAEFADWVFDAHEAGQKKTMHVLGNHTCEIAGDTAHAETYCVYFGYNRDDTIDVVGNRYIDRLERRAGEWRIADRICVVEWFGALNSGDEMDSVIKPAMADLMSNAPTSRDPADVSYRRPLTIDRASRIPPRIRAGHTD